MEFEFLFDLAQTAVKRETFRTTVTIVQLMLSRLQAIT